MTATRKPVNTLFAVDTIVGPDSVFVTVHDNPYHVYTVARTGEVQWSPLTSGNDGGTVACVAGRPTACTCKGFKFRRKCRHLTGTRTLFECVDMARPTDEGRPESWLHSSK